MDVETDLLFTKIRINKAIKSIEELSGKYNFIIGEEMLIDEDDEFFEERSISLYIPFTKKMNTELNLNFNKTNEYGNEYDFMCCDWNRTLQTKRYWRYSRGGRNLCDETHYNHVIGTQNYDSCTCPNEFKDFCKDIHAILDKSYIKNITP